MERQKIQDLISEINSYVKDKMPIKPHIDRIGEILDQVTDWVSPSLLEAISSNLKSKVQRDANNALDFAGGTGAALMATGTGKSKMAIDRIERAVLLSPKKNLIAVPTEPLRDIGWVNEFNFWNRGNLLEHVELVCYASLKNIRDGEYNLVILDEGHNLTETSAEFFTHNNNRVKNTVLMTATRPQELSKKQLLTRLGILPVYSITLDEAVKLRLVAPYEVTIIKVPLDDKDKYINAGNKTKRFKVTERQQYDYINRNIGTENETEMARKIRYKFFSNLKSKTEAAKKILERIIPSDKRTLIFAGSKLQADDLCEYKYYTNYKQKEVDLDRFVKGEINKLSCVDALNEGHNIANLDCCLKLKLDSKTRKLTQQIGRSVRFRANHTGKFIILCSENTVDEEWAMKATSDFDQSKVTWVTLEDIRTKKYIIDFEI